MKCEPESSDPRHRRASAICLWSRPGHDQSMGAHRGYESDRTGRWPQRHSFDPRDTRADNSGCAEPRYSWSTRHPSVSQHNAACWQ